MAKVWIGQCLCPQRHCIIGNAGEVDDGADAETTIGVPLREKVEEVIRADLINPWCGLCNAPSDAWIYEVAPTTFATMEEAMPTLLQAEREQRAIADVFGDIPRSD